MSQSDDFIAALGGEPDFEKMSETIMDAAEKSRTMVEEFMDQQPDALRMALDPMNLTPALLSFSRDLMSRPDVLVQNQMAFFQDYMKLLGNQSASLSGEEAEPVITPGKSDRRFKSEAWSEEGPFDFIKQAYLLASHYTMDTIAKATDLDTRDERKLHFFTKQYLDALSPSNYMMTNPDVLRETLDSKGQNLVKGMQHLLEDVERGDGVPMIKMTDLDAFEVGKNLAVTPGKVVYRNALFELIQYSPTTETVYEVPLLIFPPWINKFYILDLNEKKSFVRWAVAQGYTVFMVSWVNPDGTYADTTLDDYLKDGYLEAIQIAREITGAASVNTIGYCVAGTMLAAVLAYLHEVGEEKQVRSATFFTAQVDFSEAGDLMNFVDSEQLEFIDKLMEEKGYLDKRSMALTFNMLRSNDLIWSYVVNNYLLGKEPMAFDLLYWNCDSTNLARGVHKQYLTHMYHNNDLIKPGAMTLNGVPIDIHKVETPSYVQAGRDDHIAPAQSVFKITDHFGGPVRFVLAGSGHIAGVINPPEAKKYQYWTNDEKLTDFDSFVEGAKEHPGSWWPDWHKWLSRRSGKKVAPLDPAKGPYPPLADAPGTYVKARPTED
ncbi:PHA/PHB synthase family protein [Yunchengibacter salinarum]|uniref:PHA/PHB synthase family protein n=1 Tax=Yunchengibacter salinarum TaxID=3133399 RepID=UPI0035B5F2BA